MMVTDKLSKVMLPHRIITLECQHGFMVYGLLHITNRHRMYCYGYYQTSATPCSYTHIFDVMIDVTTHCNNSTPSPVVGDVHTLLPVLK